MHKDLFERLKKLIACERILIIKEKYKDGLDKTMKEAQFQW